MKLEAATKPTLAHSPVGLVGALGGAGPGIDGLKGTDGADGGSMGKSGALGGFGTDTPYTKRASQWIRDNG